MDTTNTEVSAALIRYYESLQELRLLGIIRGDNIAGDIGEFFALRFLGAELETSQRTQSIDGILNGRRVQVKYSQATQSRNINIGNPNTYDDLILVLHSRSRHFPHNNNSDFVIYTIPSSDVASNFTRLVSGKYTCTRNMISKIESIQQRNITYAQLSES
tara:strand:+ start:108 stop:587 length:480 start_codon:yes stop_codon:yes gene_type:complete